MLTILTYLIFIIFKTYCKINLFSAFFIFPLHSFKKCKESCSAFVIFRCEASLQVTLWNPQDLLLMMGTRILKIDAEVDEKIEVEIGTFNTEIICLPFCH